VRLQFPPPAPGERAVAAVVVVRSFCTALKPPATPAAARPPGGHAAYGRSRPALRPLRQRPRVAQSQKCANLRNADRTQHGHGKWSDTAVCTWPGHDRATDHQPSVRSSANLSSELRH
jgi:hypothetical protein